MYSSISNTKESMWFYVEKNPHGVNRVDVSFYYRPRVGGIRKLGFLMSEPRRAIKVLVPFIE